MKRLLQLFGTLIILLATLSLNGQDLNFTLELPILSVNMISADKIQTEINDDYFNEFYIPNFWFGVNYKSYYIGVESYFAHIQASGGETIIPELSVVKLGTFSVLGGLQKSHKAITYRLLTGVTHNARNFANYAWQNSIEGYGCVEANPYSLLFASSAHVELSERFTVGFNLRFNPMFQSFQESEFSGCGQLDHDRVHYFVVQLMVGYQFGKKQK